MLEREFRHYLRHQDELLKTYDGRFIVIIGDEVVGDYGSYEEAYHTSAGRYPIGTFLIQECTEGDSAYTLTFHSGLSLA